MLSDSPWAQPASAIFADPEEKTRPPDGPLPGAAQAGVAGARSTPDSRWDGGVGRNVSAQLPTLTVIVRWDSALPMREALSLSNKPVAVDVKNYIVTVKGLVPAGRYRQQGSLQTKSESSGELSSSGVEIQDPERMLEGLMADSKLRVRGKGSIASSDVKLDAGTGDLHIFFPRSANITLSNKEVVFSTRFGSLTVAKKFRLKDMVYGGRLEL